MSLPTDILTLLQRLTTDHVLTMPQSARDTLARELERVHRIVTVESIIDDARRALPAPKTGVLADLRDGKGRE